jgi:hypothetical protein
MLKLKALALAALLPSLSRAYVTSAVLEYSVDDTVAFHLNGNVLLERSETHPFDYAVLSTSDGSLPLELFNMNGDNVLAAENFDTEGGAMGLSYRLTVHQSSGDPVVVWSDPSQTRFLHLSRAQASPQGWTQPEFNDSAWEQAKSGRTDNQNVVWASLPDEAFSGLFGGGRVPFMTHKANALSTGGDHNLLRNHFRFPSVPAKVGGIVNPAQAVRGSQLAVRVFPGRDVAEFSSFYLLAWLPKNVELASQSPGGRYDPATRRLVWAFDKRNTQVEYPKIGLGSVLESPGWRNPEKALGLEKSGKGTRQLNTPTVIYEDGAEFSNGQGWFKMQPPQVDFSKGAPTILGVIFHSQLRVGGQDNNRKREVDEVLFNYSVDGSNRGALKEDAAVGRMTVRDYWFDGYYDASEDRKWSWDDIKNLRVSFKTRVNGGREFDKIASCVAVIKAFRPANVAPYFFAKVLEPNCGELSLNLGIMQPRSPLVTSDPLKVPVNTALCAPTPTPRPAPTPPPPVLPTPEPTRAVEVAAKESGKVMTGVYRIGLGCLSNRPEEFNYAGTFIYFCIKSEAEITLRVYRAGDGVMVREMKAGSFRSGDNQIFYNARDNAGKSLKPGNYIYELIAASQGESMSRNSSFTCRAK